MPDKNIDYGMTTTLQITPNFFKVPYGYENEEMVYIMQKFYHLFGETITLNAKYQQFWAEWLTYILNPTSKHIKAIPYESGGEVESTLHKGRNEHVENWGDAPEGQLIIREMIWDESDERI